jgi:replicative DNA helicase
MISAESEIDGYNLKSGRLSEGETASLNNAIGRLEKLPINIDDASNMTIERLAIIARKWYNEQGIKILFVDYLQMLKTTTRQGTRDMELGVITKGLKNIAKDLNIPVVALCSLNRTSAKEKNAPTITDLRDSGNIESDADLVILLHRPEVYLDHESITDEVRGKMEADICKNRNGKVGLALIYMDKKTRSFRDWETRNSETPKNYGQLKPRTSSQDINEHLPF